ncbi:type I restriction enzyme S subunit [Curtobacterium flaccumfaciens]|nr:restriction endonuclease subunit S [Curtobacterium flaccumfaciens]MDQ0540924.1 type I restriction enzyme S subunit [Curtobacterium flaccumfaciens]
MSLAERAQCRLGDVTVSHDSRRRPVKSSERKSGPYPYYGASGIVDHVDSFIFEGLHLLVAEDGENLRSRNTRVAYLADGQFWVNNHAHVLQSNSRSDIRYLAYAIEQSDLSRYLTGSTQPKLTKTALESMMLELPPLGEQQAIAEVLGAIDDKIAANETLAERAEALASLTYDSLVADWRRVAMSTVLQPILGGTPLRAREDYWKHGGELWVSARDITAAPARVVVDTAEKITSSAIAETKAKPLPTGSVIFTARGTVGEVGRLGRPAAFNQSCYGFRPDVVPPGLLYFSILRAAERAKAVAHGSVFDTITKATFDHLDLAWDEGQAAAVEAALSPILEISTVAVRENRTLREVRDALLPELMSGKLLVRDAAAAASQAGA